MGVRRRVRELGRRALVRAVWLIAAVLMAFGSAGIVSGMNHQPGSAARAELTWAADRAIGPGLDSAADDLRRLSTNVDGLGVMGRGALAALVDRKLDALSAAIADGKDLLVTIGYQTDAVRNSLATLPGVGPGEEGRLGLDVRTRYHAILAALDSTRGLAESWATLTAGSVAATQLTTLLADHDRYAADAVLAGSGRHYADALEDLGKADAALKQAGTLRNTLANTVDVSILDEWIARNADYDAVLRTLYELLQKSKGVVTKEVHDAIVAEREARANLPPDTRGLVVIMAEVARGGLNEAVIAIELARGTLADAVDSVGGSPGVSPSPAAP